MSMAYGECVLRRRRALDRRYGQRGGEENAPQGAQCAQPMWRCRNCSVRSRASLAAAASKDPR